MANAPDWYPDPWRPGQRRWWDGSGWTDHTFDPSTQPPVPAPQTWLLPDPRRDLADEKAAAVWAKRGFIAFFAARVFGGIISIVVLNSLIDDVRNAIDSNSSAPSQSGGLQLLQMPLSVLTMLGLAAIVVWTHKAANVARNLGYPAKHSPGWVVAGWFVPVVNFWFPYQSVRDCLAPGNPERRNVGIWWTAYLLGTTLWIPAIVVSILSSYALAVALALPAVVVNVYELQCALRVVDAVEADHTEAISRIAA